MGKKRFIEKKKSATFQLLARDSSSYDPNFPSSAAGADRVFVRVDNNLYATPAPFADDDLDPHSIFADAPGDIDGEADDDDSGPSQAASGGSSSSQTLPDHVRREILELGLPDDGYNYLLHVREIRNTGGGSSYYHNSKAKLDRVPLDVKAYDASRLRIGSEVRGGGDDGGNNSICDVAAKTVGVKVQKALDPDVVRLLDDSDLSRFGSDDEDLEEDFVARANLPVEGEEDEGTTGKKRTGVIPQSYVVVIESDESRSCGDDMGGAENPRARRILDEQFDQLLLREYDDDSDENDDGYIENISDNDDEGYIENETELSLVVELSQALKEYPAEDLDLEERYKVPGDFVRQDQLSGQSSLLESTAEVIHKCVEYAEMYSHEDQDNDVVIFEESSDESEVWDCGTIISTYSNLDNHPGKIQAPEKPNRRCPESILGISTVKNNIIELRGKEKLPVDFLPHNRKKSGEKVKKAANSRPKQQRRKPQESKEEKKERKAAVKEARREARQTKKELKGLYKCESQLAQKVAAVSGPSSFHLM